MKTFIILKHGWYTIAELPETFCGSCGEKIRVKEKTYLVMDIVWDYDTKSVRVFVNPF